MHTLKSQSEQFLIGEATARPAAHASAHEGDACATGSDTPRLVIRGESIGEDKFPDSGEKYQLVAQNGHAHLKAHPLPKPDVPAYAAITDYLNCTFPFNSNDLPIFFFQLFECLGEKFAPATDRGRGLHGYAYSFSLGNSSALFAYGGQGGTGFLSLPGEACHLVPNWSDLISLLKDRLEVQISVELDKQFDSPEMRNARRRLANQLLKNKELTEFRMLDFFEKLAMYTDQERIDQDTVYQSYSYWIERYWPALKSSIKEIRQMENDPSYYVGFEELDGEMLARDAKDGLAAPSKKEIQRFLKEEAMLPQ